MGHRVTGVALLGIAAFLFGIRYVAAALYAPAIGPSWGEQDFARYLEYIGPLPLTLAIIAFIAGIGYLAWAELEGSAKQEHPSVAHRADERS